MLTELKSSAAALLPLGVIYSIHTNITKEATKSSVSSFELLKQENVFVFLFASNLVLEFHNVGGLVKEKQGHSCTTGQEILTIGPCSRDIPFSPTMGKSVELKRITDPTFKLQ